MGTLVLLRHGQSVWNAENLFTGWVDVALSAKGEAEARRGGELLRETGLLPDIVHTSVLRRAISTANIALDVADRHWIPVKRDWRLNERHYGALQGKDKKQTLEEYGEEQFMLWRRSFDVPPPPLDDSDEWSQASRAMFDVRMALVSTEVCSTVGSRPALASSSPPSRACSSPSSVRSTSTQPVNRFFAFHSLSPWRSRISLYGASAMGQSVIHAFTPTPGLPGGRTVDGIC